MRIYLYQIITRVRFLVREAGVHRRTKKMYCLSSLLGFAFYLLVCCMCGPIFMVFVGIWFLFFIFVSLSLIVKDHFTSFLLGERWGQRFFFFFFSFSALNFVTIFAFFFFSIIYGKRLVVKLWVWFLTLIFLRCVSCVYGRACSFILPFSIPIYILETSRFAVLSGGGREVV